MSDSIISQSIISIPHGRGNNRKHKNEWPSANLLLERLGLGGSLFYGQDYYQKENQLSVVHEADCEEEIDWTLSLYSTATGDEEKEGKPIGRGEGRIKNENPSSL